MSTVIIPLKNKNDPRGMDFSVQQFDWLWQELQSTQLELNKLLPREFHHSNNAKATGKYSSSPCLQKEKETDQPSQARHFSEPSALTWRRKKGRGRSRTTGWQRGACCWISRHHQRVQLQKSNIDLLSMKAPTTRKLSLEWQRVIFFSNVKNQKNNGTFFDL